MVEEHQCHLTNEFGEKLIGHIYLRSYVLRFEGIYMLFASWEVHVVSFKLMNIFIFLTLSLSQITFKVDFHCRVNNYVRKTCAKKKTHVVNFHFRVKSKYNSSLFYVR